MSNYPTIEDFVGNTPLVRLQRMNQTNNSILLKLEGNNPAGSVKDRPALNMINQAEKNGEIKPGDTLIEATSGNTGIALAMVAAIKGYKMILVMPNHMSEERKKAMTAYGAELVLTPAEGRMEAARDKADELIKQGVGKMMNQFANFNNPQAHYENTAKEIWQDTNGEITHFVSSMGTTGTIMGVSTYLKSKNPNIQIIGVQPDNDSQIPGIRRWPKEYLPEIYQPKKVDRIIDVSLDEAENITRELAKKEGIFCGVSSGGAMTVALKVAKEVKNATIVSIVCDRGDRYLSTGVFK